MVFKIKNNIKYLRMFNNEMSQDQLATLTNVSRQTINAIEHNKYSPSLELAFKIAKVFNKEINEVFMYEPEEH